MTEPKVVIGGMGGSGTRALARVVQSLGLYIGDDLNLSYDNPWFPLLFGRRSALVDSFDRTRDLYRIFKRRMLGITAFSSDEEKWLFDLCCTPRFPHPEHLTSAWFESLMSDRTTYEPGQQWGWKTPSAYLYVERLFALEDGLKYVHLHRNGLSMALSSNKNQLKAWGPVLLDRQVEPTPQDNLAYWRAHHRFVAELKSTYPDRVQFIEFEDLVEDPNAQILRLSQFLGLSVTSDAISAASELVERPKSLHRYKQANLQDYCPKDVAYYLDTVNGKT